MVGIDAATATSEVKTSCSFHVLFRFLVDKVVDVTNLLEDLFGHTTDRNLGAFECTWKKSVPNEIPSSTLSQGILKKSWKT